MIRLLLPRTIILNANQRLHWRVKAKHTKAIRTIAAFAAVKQHPAVTEPVHVLVRFSYGNRVRPHDHGNLAPTVKAIIDGLTDALIWPDDNTDWVEGPDIRINPAVLTDLGAKTVAADIFLDPIGIAA